MKGITGKTNTDYTGGYDKAKFVRVVKQVVGICLEKGIQFKYSPYLEELRVDGFRISSISRGLYNLDSECYVPIWKLLEEVKKA